MNITINKNAIIRHKSVPDCEWCDKAKELLDEKGLSYCMIESDKWLFGSIMKETKSKKVPQIIINGEFIGDYNDLVEYVNAN
tara:strand:- start:9502 stop:9747 length:246 start_codon:yes stop_codon:yes gene_type:complete